MKIYIGNVLRELRYTKSLKQQEVAGMLFISRQTYKKWENDMNEICQTKLFLIAKIYGISIMQLIHLILKANKMLDCDIKESSTNDLNSNMQEIKKDLTIIKSYIKNLNQ